MIRLFALLLALLALCTAATAAERPNILWITSEDNGPQLGCYGDEYADTPHIDALAKRGTIYRHAWSNAPVCAPARTTIITGMYPTSLGAQHMRSHVRLPSSIRLFPQYLREAGYYCTNNVKEDYNLFKAGPVWDDSSRQAHWRNRPEGKPFFAVFNFTTSHESQIRKRPHDPVHDPAGVRVPAYHPDTPEVRRDWAQYYDKLTEMDRQVGTVLRELDADGLTDDTIVFYYGDHGPGMPRSKRWPYNSGLQVPMIVAFPEKYRSLAAVDYTPGGASERLVSFVDLAPTVLSLASIEPPEHMQGQAFHGPYEAEPNETLHGFRGRMDERYDVVRTTRNARYIYIRNFMPHRRYGEHVDYMFQTPTTQVWHKLHQEGKLTPEQSRFWEEKPAEELYDLEADPDEVRNLADSAEHLPVLEELRARQRMFLARTTDVGFLPEPMMHQLAAEDTIFSMAQDRFTYPLELALGTAEMAAGKNPQFTPLLMLNLQAEWRVVRYWSVVGLTIRGKPAVESALQPLRKLLEDEDESVRIAAAEALGRYGTDEDAAAALETLVDLGNVERHSAYTAILALNALDAVGDRARPVLPAIRQLPTEHPSLNRDVRMGGVLQNLVAHLTRQLAE